jgi:hypothetical protein
MRIGATSLDMDGNVHFIMHPTAALVKRLRPSG